MIVNNHSSRSTTCNDLTFCIIIQGAGGGGGVVENCRLDSFRTSKSAIWKVFAFSAALLRLLTTPTQDKPLYYQYSSTLQYWGGGGGSPLHIATHSHQVAARVSQQF